ncbi:hypothetical protein PF004_g19263 [Phytophthora fragariae]|uniref:Uncharacterized protein n=1 Tax=Phytophthora fragariae TaxID=53985 RepID=A0A6G0N9A8_9STRA|nr:hypothetical protein PF004_g19263 [Phytophthora fragariae]
MIAGEQQKLAEEKERLEQQIKKLKAQSMSLVTFGEKEIVGWVLRAPVDDKLKLHSEVIAALYSRQRRGRK